MAAKFVQIDHDTPMLLPPDLREWIAKDHMVHFVMDAVDALDLSTAKVNERGTGSAQYPPATMLALLIYWNLLEPSDRDPHLRKCRGALPHRLHSS